MAVSTKGWRSITVGTNVYKWRAIGTDWGITVIIVTSAAFTRGKRGQQLRFELDYNHATTPRPGGWVACSQQTTVTPRVIQQAIDYATHLSPPFTGAHDAPDIILPPEVVANFQGSAQIAPDQS